MKGTEEAARASTPVGAVVPWPSSLVQLRTTVWTGDDRVTRPEAEQLTALPHRPAAIEPAFRQVGLPDADIGVPSTPHGPISPSQASCSTSCQLPARAKWLARSRSRKAWRVC